MTSFRQDGRRTTASSPGADPSRGRHGVTMAAVAGLILAAMVVPGRAADMTFFFKNDRDREVVVEVRARDRAISWPGRGRIWLLEPLARKSVTIQCTAGEFVCYAGWDRGNDAMSFGLGPDEGGRCVECCFICVDQRTEPVQIRR